MNDFALVQVNLSGFLPLLLATGKHLKVETTALDQIHSLINAESTPTVLTKG